MIEIIHGKGNAWTGRSEVQEYTGGKKNLRTGMERRLTFHSTLLSGLNCSLCLCVHWKNILIKKKKKRRGDGRSLPVRRGHLNLNLCLDSLHVPIPLFSLVLRRVTSETRGPLPWQMWSCQLLALLSGKFTQPKTHGERFSILIFAYA